MQTTRKKQRIAILGGGVSAMTSAFYLTSYPGWKDDWEIDVYQMGWRLGGKGASGRNRKHNQRIEEHGLHIFLGFYDNAFKTMQDLYGELARSPGEPLAAWHQAWKPTNHVVFMEQIKGEWKPWPVTFPTRPGVPGDASQPLSGWGYVQTMLELDRRVVAADRPAHRGRRRRHRSHGRRGRLDDPGPPRHLR